MKVLKDIQDKIEAEVKKVLIENYSGYTDIVDVKIEDNKLIIERYKNQTIIIDEIHNQKLLHIQVDNSIDIKNAEELKTSICRKIIKILHEMGIPDPYRSE